MSSIIQFFFVLYGSLLSLLTYVIGHQNLAMLSRIYGPQTHLGFEWNPIAQPDIVQFDPDDEDNDVLDAWVLLCQLLEHLLRMQHYLLRTKPQRLQKALLQLEDSTGCRHGEWHSWAPPTDVAHRTLTLLFRSRSWRAAMSGMAYSCCLT